MSRNPSLLILLISDGILGFILCNMSSLILGRYVTPVFDCSEPFQDLILEKSPQWKILSSLLGSSLYKSLSWQKWQLWLWPWLLGKLAGSCRFLEIGMMPPAGWIQPVTSWGPLLPLEPLPHWAPPGHQSFCNGVQCDFTGKAPFPYSPWLKPEHWEPVLQSIYRLLDHSPTSCHTNKRLEPNSLAKP